MKGKEVKDSSALTGRRMSRSFVACALIFATTACGFFSGTGGSPHVTEDRLVGRWAGDCGAVVEVKADRTFTAKDFPVDFDGVGTKPQLVTGSGEWRLARAIENVRPLELVLQLKGRSYDIPVRGDEDDLVLRWQVGDPDYAHSCDFTADPA
ncbi:hypothetical protein ACFC0D_07290 [Streptomyces sp. NPDC056222]|uniref:hypothetical protein n=1 Tax=Streptomyces sp. NPDC056222 TaxID=3345749 RepID=UPI0035DC0AA3